MLRNEPLQTGWGWAGPAALTLSPKQAGRKASGWYRNELEAKVVLVSVRSPKEEKGFVWGWEKSRKGSRCLWIWFPFVSLKHHFQVPQILHLQIQVTQVPWMVGVPRCGGYMRAGAPSPFLSSGRHKGLGGCSGSLSRDLLPDTRSTAVPGPRKMRYMHGPGAAACFNHQISGWDGFWMMRGLGLCNASWWASMCSLC